MMVVNPDTAARLTESVEFLLEEGARYLILSMNHAGLWTEEAQPACRECALRLRCNNSCGCLNWQTTGSVNAISPTLCHQEQMLMPIADRLGREFYRQRNPHFLHKHYNATYPVLSMMEDALSSHGKP